MRKTFTFSLDNDLMKGFKERVSKGETISGKVEQLLKGYTEGTIIFTDSLDKDLTEVKKSVTKIKDLVNMLDTVVGEVTINNDEVKGFFSE